MPKLWRAPNSRPDVNARYCGREVMLDDILFLYTVGTQKKLKVS